MEEEMEPLDPDIQAFFDACCKVMPRIPDKLGFCLMVFPTHVREGKMKTAISSNVTDPEELVAILKGMASIVEIAHAKEECDRREGQTLN